MFVRGLQASYNSLALAHDWSVPYGDMLVFGFCCGQIMFAFLLSPETIPAEYNNWYVSGGPAETGAALAWALIRHDWGGFRAQDPQGQPRRAGGDPVQPQARATGHHRRARARKGCTEQGAWVRFGGRSRGERLTRRPYGRDRTSRRGTRARFAT